MLTLWGPLPPSQAFLYIFTVIDRFTRWTEAIPVKDITSETCARALISEGITRFGVPSDITSVRSAQFTSNLWETVSTLLGIKLHKTTTFHPQSNGMVERFHRQLKSSLKAKLEGPNWMDHLPWIRLGIRTSPKEDLNSCPAELVYGAPLVVPGEFVCHSSEETKLDHHLENLRERVANFLPPPSSRHCKASSYIPKVMAKAKYVFVRKDSHCKPLERPYEGPFQVIEMNAKTVKIQKGVKEELISIDRVKPAFIDPDTSLPAVEVRSRGLPKKINNYSGGAV